MWTRYRFSYASANMQRISFFKNLLIASWPQYKILFCIQFMITQWITYVRRYVLCIIQPFHSQYKFVNYSLFSFFLLFSFVQIANSSLFCGNIFLHVIRNRQKTDRSVLDAHLSRKKKPEATLCQIRVNWLTSASCDVRASWNEIRWVHMLTVYSLDDHKSRWNLIPYAKA